MNPLLYILFFVPVFSFEKLPIASGRSQAIIEQGTGTSEDLTISYAIEVKSKKNNTGIAETYNGGVKTVFIKDQQARLRLVSLMRMQDIFILQNAGERQKIAIVKESGKNKYKSYLTPVQWKQYNSQYEGATCNLLNDTAMVLKYPCKKAVINLKNKKTLTVYYTTAFQKPGLPDMEPAFSCVPGLVLKYEYKYKRSTITYTATTITRDPIDPMVFKLPL
jgi:GLPGLI family protein